ncbi:uncharacterized protein LOC126820491 [Patella vulgata]|uniref:uncharacterized protein LOC126820491 n=1 Tax=Patella vulgata TaxID=6465 RepID=UPI0024A7BAE9|nr:uncharacterized protein LOC126820491 [Patella vulgata]
MRLIEPAWVCLLSIWFITVYCDDQLSLDLVAAGSDVVDGNYTLDSCRSINCTSYNVTEFHVNIEWSTVTVYQPFSVLAAASRLHNTSDILIIADDNDYLRHKGQRLRIPESPIVRFPWQRNTDMWRIEKGLKPISEITPEDQLGMSLEMSRIDQFEFCESETVMSRAERDMLVKIVTNMGWKKLVIICDQSTEFETMELSTELSVRGITVTILAINETTSSYASYPGLKATYDLVGDEEMDVVLLCSLGCVKTILNEANIFDVEQKNLTAIRHSSRWLVAHYGYDQNYLEKSGITLDNVAVLIGPSYHDCYPTNIKKVLPQVVQAALRKVDSEPNYSGDVTVDGYVKSEIKSILENPTIKTNPRLATLIWKEGGRRQLDNVDIDVDGKGNIFPNTDFGFNQRVFYVATLEYSPFVIKKVTNGTAVYTGLCMDLLWELAISLNFSYVMVEPPDGEWGRVNDGKWTGLIGQVAYQVKKSTHIYANLNFT